MRVRYSLFNRFNQFLTRPLHSATTRHLNQSCVQAKPFFPSSLGVSHSLEHSLPLTVSPNLIHPLRLPQSTRQSTHRPSDIIHSPINHLRITLCCPLVLSPDKSFPVVDTFADGSACHRPQIMTIEFTCGSSQLTQFGMVPSALFQAPSHYMRNSLHGECAQVVPTREV